MSDLREIAAVAPRVRARLLERRWLLLVYAILFASVGSLLALDVQVRRMEVEVDGLRARAEKLNAELEESLQEEETAIALVETLAGARRPCRAARDAGDGESL